MLITPDSGVSGGQEPPRARRTSTASGVSVDLEGDDHPEAGDVQNRLLDIASSCLSVLAHLSPNLTGLLTNDVRDFEAYEILLGLGFSTPSFDQVSQKRTGSFASENYPLMFSG